MHAVFFLKCAPHIFGELGGITSGGMLEKQCLGR